MTRSVSRLVAAAPLLSALAAALLLQPIDAARADSLTGKIEKVENGGNRVVIGGKTIMISGARTNVCIGGICDQGRDKLKAGLTCVAEVVSRAGALEARRLSCK